MGASRRVHGRELTVDGRNFTQSLTVASDPRVDLPAAAYADAFALARKIESLQVHIHDAKQAADALRKSLDKKRKAPGSTSAGNKIDVLEARLNAVTGSTPAANPNNAWAFPPKSMRSLGYLERSLDQLFGTVEGADAAPSPAADAGYKKLAELVELTLGDWKQLQGQSAVP